MYSNLVRKLKKSAYRIRLGLGDTQVDAMHMCLGLAGEVGEVVDIIKKNVVSHKPIDRQEFVKELGDVEFYLEGLRQAYGIDREEVLRVSKDKLTKRYNGRYSDAAAIARADEAS